MTREEVIKQVAPNLSYFNDCKPSFAIQECKLWINKIYDYFEKEIDDTNIISFERGYDKCLKDKTKETCESCLKINNCTIVHFLGNTRVPSFSCNKWEQK